MEPQSEVDFFVRASFLIFLYTAMQLPGTIRVDFENFRQGFAGIERDGEHYTPGPWNLAPNSALQVKHVIAIEGNCFLLIATQKTHD